MRRLALRHAGWILVAGCSGGGGPVDDPPAVAPGAGFASGTILVVASEGTDRSLAVLSLDTATGEAGILPGSPADLGIAITDAESLAADPPRRRVFFGSNLDGRIAVFDLDAAGRVVPAPGSPFLVERPGVGAIQVSPDGASIYVGYQGGTILSRYAVDAMGSLTLAQSIPAGGGSYVETMLLLGDVLYVGFQTSSDIKGFELDAQGAFTGTLVADVPTNARPDYLRALGATLYCSLATDGSVDAFAIAADGSLARLAGAPYRFPGITQFELIAIEPGGARIAVGAEKPTASLGLFTVNGDGSLAPAGDVFVLHDRKGGPEKLDFSADGRFLYLCDHVGEGLYVLDVVGDTPRFAAVPRYDLPGRQVDLLRFELPVAP